MATVVFGTGYIGSRLVQELLFQGREVIAVDNFFASDRRAIDGLRRAHGFRLMEGSIVDPVAVERALGLTADIDSVYLLAAQASAHPDAAPAEYTEEVNLRGPRVVLEALVRCRPGIPVVFASSTRVYGAALPDEVDETTPYGVMTDLAHLSKCYVEKLMEMYAAVYQLQCRVVRLGLAYGVAPVMKTDVRFMTAPNLFCYQAATGCPLEVRGDAPLALIHVEDAARALLCAGDARHVGSFVVYNGASAVSSVPLIAEEVRRLGEARGLEVVIHNRVQQSEGRSGWPAIRSALERVGFSPRRELGEGLSETMDYFMVSAQ